VCGIFFFAFHFISNFNTAEMCVTATDTHTNRQRQYKGNNSISFQICPLIGVTKNKFSRIKVADKMESKKKNTTHIRYPFAHKYTHNRSLNKTLIQRQYKGNNSISFQICPLIGVTKNKYNTEYIQYVLFIGIFAHKYTHNRSLN
jgi:hypothetical protein